jgi:hypothetical protein
VRTARGSIVGAIEQDMLHCLYGFEAYTGDLFRCVVAEELLSVFTYEGMSGDY